jgi:hypothetical protein
MQESITEVCSHQHSVLLKLPQVFGQNFFGGSRHQPHEVPKPDRSILQRT